MFIATAADPTFARLAQAILGLAALIGIWLALFTRNALTTLDRIARSRFGRVSRFGLPQPRWLRPDNKIVFWFYRINGAVVAIGVIWMLVTGRYPH